ncbi:hypothetical protein [Micromonospora purpureochromogenes]|uniref:hypothetical protein n=1 Tax=Micromonospora purpureochromogenes TaxID=47872 RepID=UPI003F4D5137
MTARNVSYNGNLGAGASTTFGFIGTGSPGGALTMSCTAGWRRVRRAAGHSAGCPTTGRSHALRARRLAARNATAPSWCTSQIQGISSAYGPIASNTARACACRLARYRPYARKFRS